MKNWIPKLYEKYSAECAHLQKPAMDAQAFSAIVSNALARMERIETEDGILCSSLWEEDGCRVCDIPVFGYYAVSEKALSQLFCLLSEKLVREGTVTFQVHLYAHDVQALRLFAMMQFGFAAETGVFPIRELPCSAACSVRTLDKAEIAEHWQEIWALTSEIIRHLQQAPVFYSGEEFTEEIYREFYLEESTALHAAFGPDGAIVGIIETNREENWFAGEKSVNVGEAYVLPALRGSGTAQALLQYAAEYEKERGADILWVTHGTANPNARGFWDKYFEAYQYELCRSVTIQA